MKKLYAELAKVEDQDDGTLRVYGYASTGGEDSDGEVITPEAMKAALPDYMKWGAVREMHQAKAAGTAIEAEVRDDGKTWFGAHIVDTEACKKIKANVYKGLSIGGRVTGRDDVNKSKITGLNLVEVSLVDRPANPECVLTMYKAEALDEAPSAEVAAVNAIAKILDEGAILPSVVLALIEKAMAPEAPAAIEEAPEEAEIEKGAAAPADTVESVEAVADAKDMQKAEDITKAMHDTIAKLTADVETLTKRVKELEAEPLPGKIFLKALTKAQDVQDIPGKEIPPVLKHDGAVDETATAIKKAHRSGAMRIFA